MATASGQAPIPKKVVIYCHSWLPRQTDGVAVRFLAHVKELVRKGVEVTLVTPDFLPASSRGDPVAVQRSLSTHPLFVRHIMLETTFVPGYKRNAAGMAVMCAKSSFKNYHRLIEVLKEVQPDVVHMAQCASMVMVSCACLRVGVPLVMSVHTDIRASKATITPIAGAISDFGLLLSWLVGATFFPVSLNATGVLERAGVGGVRDLMRWGPMVDTSIFRPDQDPAKIKAERLRLTHGHPERFLITYVGRFSLEKNIHFLVEAARRAPDNVTVALVGDGPLGPELEQVSRDTAPKVFCEAKFLGREDVALAFAASDLGVSASCMETTGFCAFESIASGTPFLAADAMGFHEFMEPGKNSRLFLPDSPGAFDEALGTFIEEQKAGVWDKTSLVESVRHAHIPDCTGRALEAYSHRISQNLLTRVMLAPVIGACFFYNSIGERLFDLPRVVVTLFSLPLWPGMYMVLPFARTFQPYCSTRLSMWAALSASTAVNCYFFGRCMSYAAKSAMDRLAR